MDYHPNFRDISKLIRDHLSILYEPPRMKKVFSNHKNRIRTGFCRMKNLKDLVPSAHPDLNRVDTLNSDVIGCFQCNHNVCDACHNFLLLSKRIKSVATEKSYKIRQSLSCRTDYIFYDFVCLLVIDSVLCRQLVFGLNFPTTRVIVVSRHVALTSFTCSLTIRHVYIYIA